MKNTVAGSIALFTALVLAAACGEHKRGIPVKAPPVDDSYQNMVIEETWNNCVSGDADCSYARAVFPQFSTPDADFLNPQILAVLADPALKAGTVALPPDSVSASFKRFIASYGDFKKDFPDDAQVWFRDISVISNRPFSGWISLEFTQVEFQGGAHESKKTLIQNFDLRSRQVVPLAAIMKPGYETELAAKLEQAFRKERNLSVSDSLKKAGLFEETWKLPENYQLTYPGIRFFYNPYEIAPWSAGAIEITLPWETLSGLSLLKPLL